MERQRGDSGRETVVKKKKKKIKTTLEKGVEKENQCFLSINNVSFKALINININDQIHSSLT